MYVVLALVVVGVVVLGQLGLSLRRFLRTQQQHDTSLHALARTPINALTPGARVRIVGKAIGSETVKSPYGGTQCLAFFCKSSASITHSGGSDGMMTNTETFEAPSSREIRPFSVDDGTGRIAVEVDHATLDLTPAFLTKDQIERNAFGAKMIARETTSTSYHEALLIPDAPVGVIGTVSTAEDGTLRIVGTPDAPLIVSNLSGALAV